MPEGENVGANLVLDAVKEVYGDALKPAAKTLGEALDGIFKALTYYPRLWARTQDISLDKEVADFQKRLEQGVEVIPPEFRVLSRPVILGPTIQALEYAILEEDIRNMFEALLLTSMDSRTAKNAHPAFVEIIKQITSDEAKIVKYLAIAQFDRDITIFSPIVDVMIFKKEVNLASIYRKNESYIPEDSGCAHIDLGPQYIENLVRLGIIEIPHGVSFVDKKFYQELEVWFDDLKLNTKLDNFSDSELRIAKKAIALTSFGRQFTQATILLPTASSLAKESHHE
jgi:Abortive infection alpha